jgi:hypothetical protein
MNASKKSEVIALLSAGCSRFTASMYAGCVPGDIREEMERDETFNDQVARAETALIVKCLQKIQKATDLDWRAYAWLLERLDPDRFTPRKHDTIRLKDFYKFLGEIGRMIGDEINDTCDRVRIIKRFHSLAWQLGSESATKPETFGELENEFSDYSALLEDSDNGDELDLAEQDTCGGTLPADRSCRTGKNVLDVLSCGGHLERDVLAGQDIFDEG